MDGVSLVWVSWGGGEGGLTSGVYYYYYLFVKIDQSLPFYKRIQSDAFMASGCTRRTKFVQLVKLFAVKSVCRVFIFNMFTCVFKLKRPRIYVVLVITFPENGNDCSKH